MKKLFLFLFLLLLVVSLTACKDKTSDESLETETNVEVIESTEVTVTETKDESIEDDIDTNNDQENDPANNGVTANAIVDILSSNDDSILNEITGQVVGPEFLLDPEIQILIDKARDQNKYAYKVRYPGITNRRHADIYISDNLMKIIYAGDSVNNRRTFYTTVYLDTDLKQAYSFCEKKLLCSDMDRKMDADYDEHLPKTPRDWSLSFDYGVIVGKETNHKRQLTVVEYENSNIVYRVGFDTFYGLASKVYVDFGGDHMSIIDFEILGEAFGEDEMIHHNQP